MEKSEDYQLAEAHNIAGLWIKYRPWVVNTVKGLIKYYDGERDELFSDAYIWFDKYVSKIDLTRVQHPEYFGLVASYLFRLKGNLCRDLMRQQHRTWRERDQSISLSLLDGSTP